MREGELSDEKPQESESEEEHHVTRHEEGEPGKTGSPSLFFQAMAAIRPSS
jgi:hypothetical protein